MKGFESLFDSSFVAIHSEKNDAIENQSCHNCYDCVSCNCDCVSAPDDGDGDG